MNALQVVVQNSRYDPTAVRCSLSCTAESGRIDAGGAAVFHAVGHAAQGLGFDLADPLAGESKLLADLFERAGIDVLTLESGRELGWGHLNVAKNSSQRADFERPAAVNGYGGTQFGIGEIMVTAADAQQLETISLKKANHLLPGHSR